MTIIIYHNHIVIILICNNDDQYDGDDDAELSLVASQCLLGLQVKGGAANKHRPCYKSLQGGAP